MNPPLTTAQNLTLRNSVQADATLNTLPPNGDSAIIIAAAYNAVFSPDFWVWRTNVSKAELTNAPSIDGTVFNWTGSGFIGRSAGEQAAWRELFDAQGNVNPSLDNVRQAFLDIFSGSQAPAPANRTHLATVGRRKSTKVEKLYATGTGSTGSPGKMATEGPLNYPEVMQAMGW